MEECQFCGCDLDQDQSDFADSTGVAVCDDCAEEHDDELFEDLG